MPATAKSNEKRRLSRNKKNARPNPIPRTKKEIRKFMRRVLLDLLHSGDAPHAVQFGAVRELKELVNLMDGTTAKCPKNMEEQRNNDEEHAAVLVDARALLAEIAEAKSGRVVEPGEVAHVSAAGTTDAGG